MGFQDAVSGEIRSLDIRGDAASGKNEFNVKIREVCDYDRIKIALSVPVISQYVQHAGCIMRDNYSLYSP